MKTYAIAHVREGGELREVWHDQGKATPKENTFYDFIFDRLGMTGVVSAVR